MFSVFLDTCVLVPSLSRDVLLEVAEQSVYRPLWSAEVLNELNRAVRRLTTQRGIQSDVVDSYASRLLTQMTRAFPDAMVDGWRSIVETISLPDPNDRHIVAAALSGRADVVVTDNQQDFPCDALPAPLFTQTTDTFLLDSLDLYPHAVLAAVHRVAGRTGRNGPLRSTTEIAALLRDRHCPEFGAALLVTLD
jgi:predicted nucleic acid-binding protein